MKARTVKLAAVTLLAACCVAKADIVELALDCAGVYDFNTAPWSTDFDLGVSFTEISHVYIDWSGDITGGLAVQGGSDPFPMVVGTSASLGKNPGARIISVWGGEVTYPDPEAFDVQSEFELLGGSTWSDLLDGQGTISIYYEEVIILDGWYVEHGSIVLDSASLVVDGTIVPEPSALLLLAVGAVYVRAKYRRASRPVRERR